MSLPDPRSFRLDAKTVFAGIVLPGICFIVDYLTGEWITSMAPAALLTLYVLGSGSLVLSSIVEPHSRLAGAIAGVLVTASIAACLIALPIGLLSMAGAFAAISNIKASSGSRGLDLLALSILGLGTLSTAWVFVGRASLAARASVGAHVPLLALGFGALGAAFLASVTFGADRIDRWWVRSQIEQISKSNPDRWPPVLAKLSAYPLCGRERCSKLVCDRLYEEFGPVMSGSFYIPPPVPEEHEDILADYLGGSISERCRRGD